MTTLRPVEKCWVCQSADLVKYHQERFDHQAFAADDAELAAYTGERFWLKRCRICDFGQPEGLPTLPRYFERMYSQKWSDEWMQGEFEGTEKDFIYDSILDELDRRIVGSPRKLLDIGAHVGRFLYRAKARGWVTEGIELNPRTANVARTRSGAVIHEATVQELVSLGHRYDSITITDVLEHIPEPMSVLKAAFELLSPGGWISVKVPSGPAQLVKEKIRGLRARRPAEVATNLVHVNQFSAKALRHALRKQGFGQLHLEVGAPEIASGQNVRSLLSNSFRMGVYKLGNTLPGAVDTPIGLNLQAFAQKLPG